MPQASEIKKTPTRESALTLFSAVGLLLGAPFPTERDYQELADELEANPPPNLSPEGLEVVLEILRGE